MRLMDRIMDRISFRDARMQYYTLAMFLGIPDDIHEENLSYTAFKNNWLPMDRRTDRRTDPFIEIRERILKLV